MVVGEAHIKNYNVRYSHQGSTNFFFITGGFCSRYPFYDKLDLEDNALLSLAILNLTPPKWKSQAQTTRSLRRIKSQLNFELG